MYCSFDRGKQKKRVIDLGRWTGSYGIMLTPFDAYGKVDYRVLEAQVDALCGTEIDGIVVCGSTSEFLFCSERDNMKIMSVAVETARGRKEIVGGATSPGRDAAKRYLTHMSSVGIQSALVAPPYYYKHSEEEIALFYREISEDNRGVDIVAYNIPAFTNPITERVYQSLLGFENVKGIKNSGQNIKEISNQIQMKNEVRPRFVVLTGTEEAFLPCLAAGCDGAFTAFGALMPDYMKAIHRLFMAGDYIQARQMQLDILPLLRLCAGVSFPVGYKLLGKVLGQPFSYIPQSIPEEEKQNFRILEDQMKKEVLAIRVIRRKITVPRE